MKSPLPKPVLTMSCAGIPLRVCTYQHSCSRSVHVLRFSKSNLNLFWVPLCPSRWGIQCQLSLSSLHFWLHQSHWWLDEVGSPGEGPPPGTGHGALSNSEESWRWVTLSTWIFAFGLPWGNSFWKPTEHPFLCFGKGTCLLVGLLIIMEYKAGRTSRTMIFTFSAKP